MPAMRPVQFQAVQLAQQSTMGSQQKENKPAVAAPMPKQEAKRPVDNTTVLQKIEEIEK